MRANLLTHLDSFKWEDLTIDRREQLDSLILALTCATENGDKIYSTPGMTELKLKWGFLYEIISMDHISKLKVCPWLSRDHQRMLAKVINSSNTQNQSKSLTALCSEFASENNAWFGIDPIDLPRYVSDETTWQNMHSNNVDSFYSSIDKSTKYFKRFYIPRLTVNANGLSKAIERGHEHEIFKRLDVPTIVENKVTLHGEQIQMHFNDKSKSAINLNGEWKHGGFAIPKDAVLKLIEWGFKVNL
ncbi:hypothetical protein [Pedobacter frigiditerrae]|uniref:hypothetical protein n=1 Tax=Pedobacter frigiditerrae TaxID=2530452 RepID=UPI00292FA419|nr:hypothetical protein [Pedobacter frigiditerrae]